MQIFSVTSVRRAVLFCWNCNNTTIKALSSSFNENLQLPAIHQFDPIRNHVGCNMLSLLCLASCIILFYSMNNRNFNFHFDVLSVARKLFAWRSKTQYRGGIKPVKYVRLLQYSLEKCSIFINMRMESLRQLEMCFKIFIN